MSTVRYRDNKGLCRIWEDEKLQAMFWVSGMDLSVSRNPYQYPDVPFWGIYEPAPACEITLRSTSPVDLYFCVGHYNHRVYVTFYPEQEHRFAEGTLCDASMECDALGYSESRFNYVFRRRPDRVYPEGDESFSYIHNDLPDIPLFPFYRSILIPFGSDFNIIKKFENDLLFGNQNDEEKETIRGIYVDWLGDNGDHDYAELVREHGLSFEKLVHLLSKENAVHV